MLILEEGEFEEMAKITDHRMITDQLVQRARGAVHDGWFWSKSTEEKKDFRKIALKYCLSVSFEESLDFYYGFIRLNKYRTGGSAKASETESNPKWVFATLRLESNIPRAEGKWGRVGFKDEDFEKLWKYENSISTLDYKLTLDIIKMLKLKPWPNGNIFNMCQSLLK